MLRNSDCSERDELWCIADLYDPIELLVSRIRIEHDGRLYTGEGYQSQRLPVRLIDGCGGFNSVGMTRGPPDDNSWAERDGNLRRCRSASGHQGWGMTQHVGGDLSSQILPLLIIKREMNAPVDSAQTVLSFALAEARESAGRLVRSGGVQLESHAIAKEISKHGKTGAHRRTVATGVRRVGRINQQ